MQPKDIAMKHVFSTLVIFVLLAPNVAEAESDWSQVDAVIGKKAIITGSVHKYGLPRSDLNVILDGVSIKPSLALSGWMAFDSSGHEAMMMGDLVLTETEINPVMQSLLANGVEVTAIHNHLLHANPTPFYMHIAAHGDPVNISKAVKDALNATKTPFEPSNVTIGEPPKIDFDTAQVEEALGSHGKNNGGVYQFSIPRLGTLKSEGMTIAPAMGVAHAINFQPTGEGKAAITGDFVALPMEVEPLLKVLKSSGIEVMALHNHMLDDEPRLFFIHFWANADAVTLAKRLKVALDVTKLRNH